MIRRPTFSISLAFVAVSALSLTAAGAALADSAAAPLAAVQTAPAAGQAIAGAPALASAAATSNGMLSSHAVEQAANFRTFLRKAAAVSPVFINGDQVERSVASGAQFEARQMSEGAVAYAALIALQDPEFVTAMKVFNVDEATRKRVAGKLVADPNYVSAFPHADSAAGLVVATLNDEGARLLGVGDRVKKAAYDVQHQKWSKLPVPNPAVRLAQAKAISAAPMTSDPAAVAEMGRALPADGAAPVFQTVAGGPLPGPFTPVVARGLALAAIAILGQAGEDNATNVQSLLSEQTSGACLNMAKLNLYQCLAVAKPYYEDVFCLGEHELREPAQCIAKGAGKPAPMPAMLASRPVSLADSAAPLVGGAASIGLKQ